MCWLTRRHRSSHCKRQLPLKDLGRVSKLLHDSRPVKNSQLIGVWKSSRQTRHVIIPVFRCRSLQHLSRYEKQLIGHSQFDFARLLVVAERAGELGVQRSSHSLLRWGLPLRLSSTHSYLARSDKRTYL